MKWIMAALVAALTLAGGAAAATIDDLRALGYTVAPQFTNEKGCTAWHVSGFGVSTSLGSDCDTAAFQAAVDSLADPGSHFEARWQHEHPDQLAAAYAISWKCYSIGRSAPMTDAWRIIGGVVDATVPGADLPGLATTLPAVGSAGSCSTAVAIVPGASLPGVVPLEQAIAALVPNATVEAEQVSAGGWSGAVDANSGVPLSSGLVGLDG